MFENSLIGRGMAIRHHRPETDETLMSDPSDPYHDDAKPGGDPALRERAQYWVARLVAKDISATELDTLEAWLASDPRHARAFARERALWQDLDAVADALAEPSPARTVIRPMPRPGVTRRRLLRGVPVALAASLVAALIVPSLLLDLGADHRTAVGEVRSVALPDSTSAMLDSDTEISLAFDGDKRIVHLLAGRAWFDVHHEGRPFLVEALDGETRDIGTAFVVERDGNAIDVGVTQGAVRVRARRRNGRDAARRRPGALYRCRAGNTGGPARRPYRPLAQGRIAVRQATGDGRHYRDCALPPRAGLDVRGFWQSRSRQRSFPDRAAR